MKVRVQTTVIFPVLIDHEVDIQDVNDETEVLEAVYALAANILETTSIEGVATQPVNIVK
jgi:hypothetical protein